MIQPVAMEDFFITFFSAALVVLCGALYALLFALSRVYAVRWLMPLAYVCYAVLAVSVWVLARAANFSGAWQGLALAMVLGYLVAPHGIWHLCVASHGAQHAAQHDSRDEPATG